MKFKYISDPGHGWLEAPMHLVNELGIAESISSYSYMSQDGRTAYLEEDCDAPKFKKAYEASGRKFEYYEQVIPNGEAFVRRLGGFRKVN